MKKTVALLLAAATIGCTAVNTSNSDLKVIAVNGICTNSNTGDGQAEDGYINYSNVPGIQTGDTVTTYFIYTIESSGIDDIAYRYDVINN